MLGSHKLYCLLGASRSGEFGPRRVEAHRRGIAMIKFMTTISRVWEDAAWKDETGRVDDLMRKYTDPWGLRPETTSAYLCGHPTMCQNGQGILQRAGWQNGSCLKSGISSQRKK